LNIIEIKSCLPLVKELPSFAHLHQHRVDVKLLSYHFIGCPDLPFGQPP
jgi:hypothetical protein